jgi:hypothetical protein
MGAPLARWVAHTREDERRRKGRALLTRHDEQQREVRSKDPSLSPEANRRLTAELRDAVGSDAVDVPAGRADHRSEPHGTHSTPAAAAGHNRAAILIVALVLLVVGAVVALATGSWWVMVAAVALDAVAAGVLLATTISMTTAVEHPSPQLAARLEEEGVADPDGLMTSLVDDVSHEDPREATGEQRTAVTPSSEPSRATNPADDGDDEPASGRGR